MQRRCDHHTSVGGGAGHGVIRAGVCGVCITRTTLLPDPAHGTHGSTRWHLEVTRLRRLRTSSGKVIICFDKIMITNSFHSYPTMTNGHKGK